MSKHTTLTDAEIDGLNYKEAIKAARAAGAKGIWVATAKTDTFRKFLKGEITAAQAEEATLGGSGTASAAPAPSAAIEEAINRIVEEQTNDLHEKVDVHSKAIASSNSEISRLSSVISVIQDDIATKSFGSSACTPVASTVTDPDVIKRPEFNEHTYKAMSEIGSLHGKLDKLANDIAEAIACSPSVARKISAVIAPTPSSSAVDAVSFALERYASPGRAVKPLLIKGEPGAGKTFQARAHGTMFDHYIEVGIHNGTEATDLLGYQTPTVPWVDGPMSEGYRKAALGETVLICFDEILRARAGMRSLFLTPFQKTNIGGVEYYKLRTGRFIEDPKTGVHVSEELLAPVANLAIVATTNVGAQYDVEEGDPADKRRFVHLHVKVDEAKVRTIVDGYVKARGFDELLTFRLVEFWKGAKVLVTDGFLGAMPNISTLCEALEFATNEADVPTELYRLGMNLWVSNTLEGEPEPEQVKKVTAVMASAFGGFTVPVGM